MNDWQEYFDTPIWKDISQIQGFMEIGMHEESIKLAKKLLKSESIDFLAFQQAVHAIFIGVEHPKKFKNIVYAAY